MKQSSQLYEPATSKKIKMQKEDKTAAKISSGIGIAIGIGMLPFIYFSIKDYLTQLQLILLFSGIALAIPTGIFLGMNRDKWNWFRQTSKFLKRWEMVIFILVIAGMIILQVIK